MHSDVTPANICVSFVVDFVLVDLGSVVPVGAITQSNEAYLPWDVPVQCSVPAVTRKSFAAQFLALYSIGRPAGQRLVQASCDRSRAPADRYASFAQVPACNWYLGAKGGGC